MTATADRHQAERDELKDGRVVAIYGPVVDVEFPPDALPEINQALEMDIELEGETITVTAEVAQQIGEGRVRAVCLKPTDGLTARHDRAQHRPRHPDAGRRRHARPRVERDRRAARHRASQVTGHRRPLGHPPRRAAVRRARAQGADVRDRHQGHRPPRAVRAGRQDRPLRRRRRGQDRSSSRR